MRVDVKFDVGVVLLLGSITAGCILFRSGTIVFEGNSMLPAIHNGDRLKTLRLDAQLRSKLDRGDIVAFLFPKDTSKGYIKRIIALPGEIVEIQKGEVFVNGAKLSEPYLAPELNLMQRSYPAVIVPQRSYYVLGDNRDSSSDSRLWGFVLEDLIYAKVVNH
jgi:signal peptidase I